ncbi:Na+/H+ antiporter subunit E [Roseomonas terrae]|jgi:multicomponent K+:H+ antiporter subunit E|uniref:Na+/H+ antiporter subunit E n=1 Tax=Neoroseomonas terrae TaxID=424799 RepID=A0ABS5EJL3_9PROT|nr:Na+/H+ antiporter subunit E [Neoroseomonas terrae]MBR0651219.1 Na+/H+ antiporter subunit E [Neoroseomonas terrae]
MRRWLPYPLVALSLLVLWLLLTGSTSPGAFLLGGVLAVAGSGALAALTMPAAHLRRLATIPALLLDILVEIVRSNNAVARIILSPGGTSTRRSGFVRISLDMRSPHGLAALACILTATPGTVWVEYDSSDGTMLLHVLDLIDDEAWVRIVKDRWERRLMDIFE